MKNDQGINDLYKEICSKFDLKRGCKSNDLYKIISRYNVKTLYTKLSPQKLVDVFIQSKESEGVSTNTIRSYRARLKLFTSYLKANKININDLNKQSLNSFILSLERSKIRGSSIGLTVTIVKIFLDFLVNEDIISGNPAKNLRYKRKKNNRHSLTDLEVKLIRNSLSGIREKALIEFMLSSGCRVSEICEIRYDDINFSNNTIVVTGKGDKDRVIMFNDKTSKLLKKYHKQSKNKEYLFSGSKYPYKKLSRFAVEKIIKEIGERCNLEHSLHPHLFRHTFATTALNKGMDITSIQKLLGHDNLSTTQIYAELSNKRLSEQYNKIMND